MATRATFVLQDLADDWERLYDSAVFSGILPDRDHLDRGGYHVSIQDQVDPDNYSIVRPDDKAPPGTWPRDCASAIDMNLGLADMKVCHGRLVAVWRNRASDPRAKYINAHNGWNGEGNAGRYDWVTGAAYSASDDHKWHVHLEVRRRYVNDPKAAEAVLSILSGEPLDNYLEGDMALTGTDADVIWKRDIIRNPNQRADSATNTTTAASFAVGDMWQQVYHLRDQVAALGRSLTSAIQALAGKDTVDEQALAAALAPGVAASLLPQLVAALPEGVEVTEDKLQAALVGALREFAGQQSA